MILKRIEQDELPQVYSWLSNPRNSQWLDLERVGPWRLTALLAMLERDSEYICVFKTSPNGEPQGVVALTNINWVFGTAMPWWVLNTHSTQAKFNLIPALQRLIEIAFEELKLRSLSVWTVDTNKPAVRLVRRLGFRYMGRQRSCHVIQGKPFDRLWFDLLDAEYRRSMSTSRSHDWFATNTPAILNFPLVQTESPVSGSTA
jgi:RimJ/RimL family protein N-acetyltransferase